MFDLEMAACEDCAALNCTVDLDGPFVNHPDSPQHCLTRAGPLQPFAKEKKE